MVWIDKMSARKIIHSCIDCGKERLVELRNGKPRNLCCLSCGRKVLRLPKDYKPIIGEVRTGTELKLILPKIGGGKYIANECIICGKLRWLAIRPGQKVSDVCTICARRGSRNYRWNGGKYITYGGYILVYIAHAEFWAPMMQSHTAYGGYVLEHRLIMAKHLGRCLAPFEVVHHKNGIKTDNRIENLELTMLGNHSIQHGKGYRDGYTKGLVDGRNAQIEELRKEIRLLHWQLEEAERL